jgi:hypothetical protein
MGKQLPRFEVAYYDERAGDVVVVGQWEMTLAERKFGVGTIAAGSMDAITYAVFLGARRCGLVSDGLGYDQWASEVAVIEEAGEGESPAPPAT